MHLIFESCWECPPISLKLGQLDLQDQPQLQRSGKKIKETRREKRPRLAWLGIHAHLSAMLCWDQEAWRDWRLDFRLGQQRWMRCGVGAEPWMERFLDKELHGDAKPDTSFSNWGWISSDENVRVDSAVLQRLRTLRDGGSRVGGRMEGQGGGPSILPFLQTRKNSILARKIVGSLTSTTTTTPRFSLSLSLSVESSKPVDHGDMRPGISSRSGTGRHKARTWGCGQLDRPRPSSLDDVCRGCDGPRAWGRGCTMMR